MYTCHMAPHSRKASKWPSRPPTLLGFTSDAGFASRVPNLSKNTLVSSMLGMLFMDGKMAQLSVRDLFSQIIDWDLEIPTILNGICIFI